MSKNLKHRKFHTNMQEKFFIVRVTELEETAQRGYGASFSGDVQHVSGHFPAQPTVGSLLLHINKSNSLTEVPSSPQDFWFCDHAYIHLCSQ